MATYSFLSSRRLSTSHSWPPACLAIFLCNVRGCPRCYLHSRNPSWWGSSLFMLGSSECKPFVSPKQSNSAGWQMTGFPKTDQCHENRPDRRGSEEDETSHCLPRTYLGPSSTRSEGDTSLTGRSTTCCRRWRYHYWLGALHCGVPYYQQPSGLSKAARRAWASPSRFERSFELDRPWETALSDGLCARECAYVVRSYDTKSETFLTADHVQGVENPSTDTCEHDHRGCVWWWKDLSQSEDLRPREMDRKSQGGERAEFGEVLRGVWKRYEELLRDQVSTRIWTTPAGAYFTVQPCPCGALHDACSLVS